MLLKLKNGDVVIEMFSDDAPNHVARIKELVRAGFYNGLKFHRVIDGFMAQTVLGRGVVDRIVVYESFCFGNFVRAEFLTVQREPRRHLVAD